MQYGFSFRDVRERQKQQKAANQQAQKQYNNRGAGQESSLAKFQALYDADPKLMAGNSVDAATLNPQQFNEASGRAGEALLASLKSSGHELSERGLAKFIEYVNHHYADPMILDIRRVEVMVAAFNRASEIGLFSDGDFKTQSTPKTAPLVGRAREEADRAEYRANLRAELGDAKYEAMYGSNGQHPLGARRPNF